MAFDSGNGAWPDKPVGTGKDPLPELGAEVSPLIVALPVDPFEVELSNGYGAELAEGYGDWLDVPLPGTNDEAIPLVLVVPIGNCAVEFERG